MWAETLIGFQQNPSRFWAEALGLVGGGGGRPLLIVHFCMMIVFDEGDKPLCLTVQRYHIVFLPTQAHYTLASVIAS